MFVYKWQDELQALRDESAELVRQRDRLGEEMSSLHDQLQSATEEKNLLGRELEAMKNKYDEFSKSHEVTIYANFSVNCVQFIFDFY